MAEIIEEHESKDNATRFVIKTGWDALNDEERGGPLVAIRIFNAAWSIEQDNFYIFWGYGIAQGMLSSTRNTKELLEDSVNLFDKAVDLWNEEDELFPGDKITLYCDASFSNLRLSEYNLAAADKAITLAEQGISIEYSNVDPNLIPNFDKSKASCLYSEAQAYTRKGDYSKSWEMIKRARELSPEEYGSDDPFVIALSEIMPEP